MPALPAVSKVVRMDFHSIFANDTNIMWRMFFNYAGALSTADAATWCSASFAAISTGGGPLAYFTADWALKSVRLTDLTSSVAPSVQFNGSTAGTGAGIGVPPGVACVISFQVVRRYRGGHPRLYLAGIVTGQLFNEGQWAGTFVTGMRTAFKAFIAAIIAGAPAGVGAVSQVNVSYYSGFTNKTFPSGRIRPVPTLKGSPGSDLVVDLIVNPKTASQRRRNQQSR